MSGSPWTRILAEEKAVLDLVDAADPRSMLWVKDEDTAGLSPEQRRAVETIGGSPWLVCPLSAPAGAGKTTSMRALAKAAHKRSRGHVLVLAPTGKAVDVAVRKGPVTPATPSPRPCTCCATTPWRSRAGPWSSSTRPAWSAPTSYANYSPRPPRPGPRPCWSATRISWPRSKPAAGCSPNCAPICPGPSSSRRCGGCATPRNAPPRWRCATAGRRRCAARSAGTAPTIGCTAGTRSRWPTTRWPPTAPTPPRASDALLVCDTREMCDALNGRIHGERISADAPTVTGARGQRIGVGDLIISRRNDPSHRRRASHR